MGNFVVLTGKKIENEWLRVYVQDKNGFWAEHIGSTVDGPFFGDDANVVHCAGFGDGVVAEGS